MKKVRQRVQTRHYL